MALVASAIFSSLMFMELPHFSVGSSGSNRSNRSSPHLFPPPRRGRGRRRGLNDWNGAQRWNGWNDLQSYRVRMFVRTHVHRLFDLGAENFLAVLAVGDHGVVIQGDLAPPERRFVDFRPFFDFVAEN